MKAWMLQMLSGFDGARLCTAARTAGGALVALFIANALGVDSPGWAAMTVFLVSQPTRDLLKARSFYRLLGTIVGAVVGAGAIVLAGGSALLLVSALAVWLAACSWMGNVARPLRSYGALLSGYTAAIVALLSLQHHGAAAHLAVDRIEGVLVGCVIALAVNGVFTPRSATVSLLATVPRLVSAMLGWAARVVEQGPTPALLAEERRLVQKMAEIEVGLDEIAFGSPRKQQHMMHIRGLFAALLTLGSAVRAVMAQVDRDGVNPAMRGWREALVTELHAVHRSLEAGESGTEAVSSLRRLVMGAPQTSRLAGALAVLVGALDAVIADRHRAPREGGRAFELDYHRDWTGARLAALRTFIAVAIVGSVWVLTGWQYGAFMVMGCAVFMPLFSTMEKPSAVMRNVTFGSLAGIVASISFSALVIPLVETQLQLFLAMIPVLAIGVLALSHRRTMLYGMDFCLVFFLIVHPTWPMHTSFADTLGGGTAMAVGLAVAWACFSHVLPVNPRRRLGMLTRHIVLDVEGLARSRVNLPAWKWRARMHHRILRLVARATAVSSDIEVGDGMAALALGDAVLHMQGLMRRPDLPVSVRGALQGALDGMAQVSNRPAAAGDTLREAAARLREWAEAPAAHPSLHADADLLRDAAEALAEHQDFFLRGARQPGRARGSSLQAA